MILDASTVAIIVMGAALACLVGRDVVKWVFQKDTEAEKRRTAAFHLATTLKAKGLKRIPGFLGKYAVGDLSGMFSDIHDLAKLVMEGGEDAILKEFEDVYKNVLAAKLATPEGRAYIAALMTDAKVEAAAKA